MNGILKTKLEEIDQWKRKINDRDNEISKLKNMENELYNYESKINNLKIENDRINGILKSRLSEIEEWKGRCKEFEREMNGYEGLQKEKKSL